MLRRSFLIGGVLLIVAIGIAITLTLTQNHTFHGVVYENPKQAPQLNLVTAENQQFNLADYNDKIILLFFGYTSCPDVCPSTLSDMKRVMNILGEDSKFVQVLFVTVDPERDTADKLRSYMDLFSPTFIGLTGAENDLAKVWGDYGVIREIDTSTQSAVGYLVNHTSRIYLIDRTGRLLITYGFGTFPEDISKDIEYLLKTN